MMYHVVQIVWNLASDIPVSLKIVFLTLLTYFLDLLDKDGWMFGVLSNVMHKEEVIHSMC
jgi:hypothetical protein